MSSELRRIVIRALALPFALAVLVATLNSTEILYLRRLAGAVDRCVTIRHRRRVWPGSVAPSDVWQAQGRVWIGQAAAGSRI